MVLQNKNSSIADAIILWKVLAIETTPNPVRSPNFLQNNIDKEFEGAEDCKLLACQCSMTAFPQARFATV